MHLTVFKTSVATIKQVQQLQSLLNLMPLITQWNFDLDDCDHILRIISRDSRPQMICQLLQTEGFNCETMETFVYRH
jgi:cell fate (sporulation/competence/biofilm development) regulator YmcA (YheA/YmcA/DUF963 family)